MSPPSHPPSSYRSASASNRPHPSFFGDPGPSSPRRALSQTRYSSDRKQRPYSRPPPSYKTQSDRKSRPPSQAPSSRRGPSPPPLISRERGRSRRPRTYPMPPRPIPMMNLRPAPPPRAPYSYDRDGLPAFPDPPPPGCLEKFKGFWSNIADWSADHKRKSGSIVAVSIGLIVLLPIIFRKIHVCPMKHDKRVVQNVVHAIVAHLNKGNGPGFMVKNPGPGKVDIERLLAEHDVDGRMFGGDDGGGGRVVGMAILIAVLAAVVFACLIWVGGWFSGRAEAVEDRGYEGLKLLEDCEIDDEVE